MRIKIERKFADNNGTMYMVSGLPDHHAIGDTLVVQTPDEIGTDRQNRMFHRLLAEIYKSRAWSFASLREADYAQLSWIQFRELVKLEYGEGAEYYVCASAEGKTEYHRKIDDARKYIAVAPIAKSWRKYSKDQRRQCIDRVISWANDMGLGYLCEEIIKNDTVNH